MAASSQLKRKGDGRGWEIVQWSFLAVLRSSSMEWRFVWSYRVLVREREKADRTTEQAEKYEVEVISA